MDSQRRRFLSGLGAVGGSALFAGCNGINQSVDSPIEEIPLCQQANFESEDGDQFMIGAYVPLLMDTDETLVSDPGGCTGVANLGRFNPGNKLNPSSIIAPEEEVLATGSDGFLFKDLHIPIYIVWDSTLDSNEGIAVQVEIEPIHDSLAEVFSNYASIPDAEGTASWVPLPEDRMFNVADRVSEVADSGYYASTRITYPIEKDGNSLVRTRFKGGFTIPVRFSLEVDFSGNCAVPFEAYPLEGPYTETMLVVTSNNSTRDITRVLGSAGRSVSLLETVATGWASAGADAVQLTALNANRDDLSEEQFGAGVRVSIEGITGFNDILTEQVQRNSNCFTFPAGPSIYINNEIESGEQSLQTRTDVYSDGPVSETAGDYTVTTDAYTGTLTEDAVES